MKLRIHRKTVYIDNYELLTFFLELLRAHALHSRVTCETCLDSCHRSKALPVSHFASLEVEEASNYVDDETLLYFCQGAII